MDTKRVNIYPSRPILYVRPPIYSRLTNVVKPINYIRCCMMNGASVEEILNDGSVIKLNMANYDTDNNPKPSVVTPKASESAKNDIIDDTSVVLPKVVINKQTAPDPIVNVSITGTQTAVVDEKKIYEEAYAKAIANYDMKSMNSKARRNADYKSRKAAEKAVEEAKNTMPTDPDEIVNIDIESIW